MPVWKQLAPLPEALFFASGVIASQLSISVTERWPGAGEPGTGTYSHPVVHFT